MPLKLNDIKFTHLDRSPERIAEMDRQMKELAEYCRIKKEESDEIDRRVQAAAFKNHYATGLVTKKVAIIRKCRQLLASRKYPNERNYAWSMGYNNLTAKYTPEGSPWSRFTGSSINRKPKPMYNEKNIPPGTADLLKLARKVFAEMSRLGRVIPWQAINFLRRQDAESEGEFRLWLSEQVERDVFTDYGMHVLSARSRGKIKDKATAFFRASAGDRVFCTLTFVDAVSDRTGVAILNKFLTSLRKKFSNLQFLWVAERQEKNTDYPGNIHFHLILNKRLPVRYYNALWVLQQYNAGLRAKNKWGELITMEEVDRRFKDRTMQKILNPLDVKRVRSISGLSMYLTKYITKQKKNDPFGCACWHCSRKVSRLFTRAAVDRSAFAYMMSLENAKVDKKTGEVMGMPVQITGSFYVMVYVNNKEGPLKYLREMEQINKWMLKEGLKVGRDDISIDNNFYNSHYKR
jgi:hypothetical protein